MKRGFESVSSSTTNDSSTEEVSCATCSKKFKSAQSREQHAVATGHMGHSAPSPRPNPAASAPAPAPAPAKKRNVRASAAPSATDAQRSSSSSSPSPSPSLPILSRRTELLQAISSHATTIVVGETGSGKSTQLPQFLASVQAAAKATRVKKQQIVCTQPRRVAATTLARRVSEEMGTVLGAQCGYSIRFDDCTSEQTVIKASPAVSLAFCSVSHTTHLTPLTIFLHT